MTVTSIDGSTGSDRTQAMMSRPGRSQMQAAMGSVAQLFGEDPGQLMNELRSGGTSLSSLAQSKGISQNDVVSALTKGLQQPAADGSAPLSSSQISNMASSMASKIHHGHHRSSAAGASGAASQFAGVMGANGGGADSDGDHDGSSAAVSGPAAGADQAGAQLKLDMERLMFDLKSMSSMTTQSATSTLQAVSSGAASTGTSRTGPDSTP